MIEPHIRKLEDLVRDLRSALSHADDPSYMESRICRIASDMESEIGRLKSAAKK